MKSPLQKGAAAAAQEERWRKLQEYLAARGKLKQSSAKPYLKDKTNQQNLVPSKSDPTRCKKNITLNKTKGEQKRETKCSVPASQVPQSRLSGAPISQKPQNVPSERGRKGPLRTLPLKASAENLTGKQSIAISSSKHGLCQVGKTKKLEPVTKPKTQALHQNAKGFTHSNHPVESSQEKVDKENLGSKLNPSLEKKAVARLGLPSGSHTLNSRPNAAFASRGSMPVKRKLLEQWLKSQGKSYKRPSMTLPAAKSRKKKESLNQSFWSSLGEEEERMDHSLRDKISSTLMECLKLAEQGFPSEEILAMLSQIPEAEKFAQFWICKAKLLARHGTFDVAGLYEAAVRAGAVPLQKLKEVVADLLKNPDKTAQVIPTQVSPLPARDQVEMSPPSTLRRQTCKPVSGIKLQVVPLLRAKECCTRPDTKLLTPVRRSLRIEGASACYPDMLKDHDTVVTSLDQLRATDHGSLFVFRKNEALPEDVEVELLRL
ncbi:PREDICTED: cytoskeleton-associated protein 2-like [Gekko japonicus]|uniref:Cytoskeleton-associated protein 2-like n=1 Tax=Gekko japonicus TaxID=146911 RepID=A0ABM1KS89_GEKJA|nr:PREDICTED: cytoskeleton-associated protein 2-like [Gekko japonicus]